MRQPKADATRAVRAMHGSSRILAGTKAMEVHVTFEEHFRIYAGTPEESLINRPQRIEVQMELSGCTREEAAQLDKVFGEIIAAVPAMIGKCIDEAPEHLRSYALPFFLYAGREALSDLEKLVRDTTVASLLAGNRPVIINPKKPDCNCGNCNLIRDIDRVLRPEVYHG